MNHTDRRRLEQQYQAQKAQAIHWLAGLQTASPLGKYLLNCIICGKSSEGKLRCKKHKQEYDAVFFDTNENFYKTFGNQL